MSVCLVRINLSEVGSECIDLVAAPKPVKVGPMLCKEAFSVVDPTGTGKL